LASCLAASLIIFFFTNLMVIRLIIIILILIVVIEVVIIVIVVIEVVINFDIGWLIILRSHISSRPECPLNDYSRASHSVFNFRQPK